MAHTGQVEDLDHDDPNEPGQEPSSRQRVNMMVGIIHMMKQQLKDMKLPSPSTKEITAQHDQQY
eukprot:11705720-Prorocentrum_lima.AAC.1